MLGLTKKFVEKLSEKVFAAKVLNSIFLAGVLALSSNCASKHNRMNVIKKTETTESTHHAAQNSSDQRSQQGQTSSDASAGQSNLNPASAAEVAGQAPMTPGQATQAPINAAATRSTADRSLVSSIDFQPGRKGLSAEATAELNRLILEAKQKGEVQQVNVAVWSDAEGAAVDGRQLPASQVQLAQQRAQNIEKYLDRMEPSADVRVINMAKKPLAFVNFLNSQNPTVKEKLSALGTTTEEGSADIKGRSSSAVVVIQVR